MPRNILGTYELPEPPFVVGTVIRSATVNAQFADIEDALTTSLSRDGDGPMRAPLRLVTGSATEPALAFADDTGAGFYLPSGGTVRIASALTDMQQWTTSKVTIYPACDINGNVSLGGSLAVTASTTLTGPTTINGTATLNGGTMVATGATADAAGTAQPTKYSFGFTAIPTATGLNYPLTGLAKTTAGNVVGLNTRVWSTATVSSWTHVDLGFTFDVDSAMGAGGSFRWGSAGFKAASATAATASAPTAAPFALTNCNLSLDGVATPTSTVAVKNAVTPSNIPKAWATISTSGGVATVTSGFNIASASVSGGTLTVVFAQQFANTTYSVVATFQSIYGLASVGTKTTSQCTILAIDISNASGGNATSNTVNFGASAYTIHIMCMGVQ